MMNRILESRNYSDVTLRPFSYISPSIKSAALVTTLCLLPQLIMLAITLSWSSLLIILATLLSSLISDFLYSKINRQNSFNIFSAIVQGILIGMFIPSNYFVPSIFIITFFTIFFVKYAFGGFAGSWANPIAVTILLAYFLSPSSFSSIQLSMQNITTRNAALSLFQDGSIPLLKNDYRVTEFFNNMIFRLFKVEVPEGYITLLWDTGAEIPAFRFNTITLFSSIFLFAFEIFDMIIPFTFIVSYAFLVKLFGPLLAGQNFFQGDIFLAIFTGGTLFGATYLLQWYGTSPVTKKGKFIFGLLSGLVAFLVMGLGTSSIGFIFLVIIMNAFSTVIQICESHQVRKHIETSLKEKIKKMEEE